MKPEVLDLGSARIKWGLLPQASIRHAVFYEEMVYVPLCTHTVPGIHKEIDWEAAAPECPKCRVYYDAIMEDRLRRRREREAARRRERYHADKEFRKRVLDVNKKSAERKAAGVKDPVEVFDDVYAKFEKKWAENDGP